MATKGEWCGDDRGDRPQELASGKIDRTDPMAGAVSGCGARMIVPGKVRKSLNRVGTPVPSRPQDAATLHERLSAYRLATGLTQAMVAEQTMVQFGTDTAPHPLGRTTLAMYETGAVEPSLAVIEQLAAIYRCPPGLLAFGRKKANR